MADLNSIYQRYNSLTKDIGKSGLNALYPNDFEYYLCAFELVSETKTVDYFVFPIQPSSIVKNEPVRTNIKSSMSGITVLKNKSFIPKDIVLKGNFGKKFKIMSMQGAAFTSNFSSVSSSNLGIKTPSFSVGIKTGYGVVKLLQSILSKSNKLNENGKPYQLYFYNMAFGESYLVTLPPSGYSFSQSEDKNMIWDYVINLKVLSPLSEIATIKNSAARGAKILSKNVIQNTLNIVAKETKLLLGVNTVYKEIIKL